jgi:uncharacterized protein YndB with AHSA1/START domain
MNAATLTVTTPTDTTIAMTRRFDAPRRLVWESMTSPAKLRRWLYAPPGWEMTVCEFDARVGGGYRWVWADADGRPIMTLHGEVTELVAPSRVVHTQVMEMHQCAAVTEFVVAMEFIEAHGVTQMRLTLTFRSKADRDNALLWGMENGMEVGYAQLDAMLARDN